MPSIYLRPVSNEQFLQLGGIESPPSLQLRTGNIAPSDISVYSVNKGIPSTITLYNNTDILLYPVVDDTPIVIPTVISISIFLQAIPSINIISGGNDATPPTLQLRTGEISPTDIKLQIVNGGILSTKSYFQSIDLKLYPAIITSVNIVIQDVYQSQSIENVEISQVHNLAIDNAAQNQVLESPSITQVHIISIQDVAQSQVIDNISITQIHFPVIQDMIQAQSIENIAISQIHFLLVDDVLQNQSIENLIISQVHAILVDDLLQAQTIDSISITQLHNLIIQDMMQSQSIENVVITQNHILAINDILQSQGIQPISITQKHILAVNNMFQSQIIENLLITQVHNLVIDDMMIGRLKTLRIKQWTGTEWKIITLSQ
jgi:hypothetical protein